jgi:putative ABC transport system substrate-binding protein
MERRAFIGALAGLLAAPLAAEAQEQKAGKVFRLGILGTSPPTDPAAARLWGVFFQRLRELGYVEGQNLTVERRFSEGRAERLPDLAADLVRLKVDVIVAASGPAPLAAQSVTKTIPIVMTNQADPVGSGLGASLARPGGNITGLSLLSAEIVGKQLQLLKEVIPEVSRVAVLRNPTNKDHALLVKEVEAAARSLRVQIQTFEARGPEEFDGAFAAMTGERAGAVLVLGDPMFFLHRTRIADLATKQRLPAMFVQREHAEAGGLLAYGANLSDMFRQAATFVDKILKGAKPADLPVEQATKLELVINLKTAKALGLTIPQSLMLRADQVIQ